MKIVPLNRLLIQPTVQCKWIEQHKTIEFVLDEATQRSFEMCWQAYTEFTINAEIVLSTDESETPTASIISFLNSAVGRRFELHNDDVIFALLAGADFIQKKYPQFTIQCGRPNLKWSID